jgi:hypothetical protein
LPYAERKFSWSGKMVEDQFEKAKLVRVH